MFTGAPPDWILSLDQMERPLIHIRAFLENRLRYSHRLNDPFPWLRSLAFVLMQYHSSNSEQHNVTSDKIKSILAKVGMVGDHKAGYTMGATFGKSIFKLIGTLSEEQVASIVTRFTEDHDVDVEAAAASWGPAVKRDRDSSPGTAAAPLGFSGIPVRIPHVPISTCNMPYYTSHAPMPHAPIDALSQELIGTRRGR